MIKELADMNKKLIAAAALLAFVAGAGLLGEEKLPKPATKEGLKLMQKADKAVKDKDFDAALAAYAEVQKLEPAYAPGFLLAAQVCRMKQDDEGALVLMEKAIQANPAFTRSVDIYVGLLMEKARQAGAQGKPDAAVPYFGRIVAIPGIESSHKSLFLDGLFNMGVSAFQARQFEASIVAFDKLLAVPDVATAAKSNYMLAHYMMGFNLSLLEKPTEANEYLRKYVELTAAEPGNTFAPVAGYMIAKNEYALLDKDVAKVRADKEEKDVLGKVKALSVQYANIPELLGKAITARPDLEDAYLVLGNYYYLSGDLDKALATYRTLLEKCPTSPSKAEYEVFLKKLEDEKAKAAEPKK